MFYSELFEPWEVYGYPICQSNRTEQVQQHFLSMLCINTSSILIFLELLLVISVTYFPYLSARLENALRNL